MNKPYKNLADAVNEIAEKEDENPKKILINLESVIESSSTVERMFNKALADYISEEVVESLYSEEGLSYRDLKGGDVLMLDDWGEVMKNVKEKIREQL